MRLSKQLYVTDLSEGWKGIYSPFGHKIAFLYDEAWAHLKDGNYSLVNDAIVRYLMENNILVEDGFEEKWWHEKLIPPTIKLNSMYLITTMECNFACKYCVVRENVDSPARYNERMSPHIASLAVDLFEQHLCRIQPGDARVTLYGGEPMLNQEVIFYIVPKIKTIRYPNQTAPVEIVMITNGYLYNSQITELFKKHGVGVCVSIDGKKKHHDVARVTRKGSKATFETVINNYLKYQAAGLSVGISTALGRHNVFDLPEICEFYANELNAKLVEFQIPYQVSGEGNPLWVSTAEIAVHLMEAYDILRSHGVIEATTYRRLRDFARGKIHYRDCGASGSQLVVAPDGMLGPCHSLVGSRTFYAGNVTDPDCDPTELDNFKEWARRFPLNMSTCQDCPFISICGGGCLYNSYVSTGSIWQKDPQVCIYMQEMIEWILRDTWKETGMAAKHGMKKREKQAPGYLINSRGKL